MIVDKKQNRRLIKAYITSVLNKDDLIRGSNLIYTSKDQQDKRARVNRGKDEPPNIPLKYRKYIALFKEELIIKVLPRYQP